MITVYHSPGTRGIRAIWLCEELDIEYEVEKIDFSKEYRMSEDWLNINPLGKVPSLRDGSLLMFESCAMMQYLLDRYGKGQLQPLPGSLDHALFLQWLWFSEATFARPIGEIVNHRREFPGDLEYLDVAEEMKSRTIKCTLAVDNALQDRDFILGNEFSAADISLGYTIRAAKRVLGVKLADRVESYFDTLSLRVGFKVAVDF